VTRQYLGCSKAALISPRVRAGRPSEVANDGLLKPLGADIDGLGWVDYAEMADRAWQLFLENWTWEAVRPRIWGAVEDCLRLSASR
jgi:hypothetical protein